MRHTDSGQGAHRPAVAAGDDDDTGMDCPEATDGGVDARVEFVADGSVVRQVKSGVS